MEKDPAWTDRDLAQNPHEAEDKAIRVEQMFSAIAESYDINNRVHSMWRDQAWRRAAVKMATLRTQEQCEQEVSDNFGGFVDTAATLRGDVVMDVACGTGDLSMAFIDGGAQQVIGIDFTENMLKVARHKSMGTEYQNRISYQAGDAMRLPAEDESVDVVSIAFGIRNVARPKVAMGEFCRVLKPGGRLIVLEFSLPTNPLLLMGYNFYFRHVMPRTAAMIARDKSGAYKYLPKSVNTFIGREQMVGMMNEAGFEGIKQKAMTFGIAVCYRGVKPAK
ncbi:UbiE/COQ5 methyltransferase [Poriferisphaera corsica]|uniref:Demethylmenaquinone methyltransferase n=1 Tax=Poriferisphaera corsica TaxID=2528020 RepID=A0A517YUY4_9BACT|nr:ubiquinone/menaquinone biosynthesis methyltransferase [Poriferisphaera corsica]QDU34026.1 UbiE/COQ5 methyltransferase [Poriferisphaera corsica]